MSSDRLKIGVFYTVSALFLALNLYLVVSGNNLLLNLLPFAFAVVLLAFVRLDYLLLAIVFFTPMSFALKELVPGLSFDMNLPTEPLIVGVLALYLIQFAAGERPPGDLIRHPVSKAIAFYLLWMFVTSLTSTMPLVSFKFFVSKLWFIVGFYLLGYRLFLNPSNFKRFVLLYGLGFVPVIAYAWWRHSSYGFFDQQAANIVMNPFYKDHTSYGAMLVFFMPALLVFSLNKSLSKVQRSVASALFILFGIALIFSYTRAAWLSLFVAGGVFVVMWLKIRLRTLLVVFGGLILLLLVSREQIAERIEKNKQQSSSELAGHLESVSNVTTDASNVERLNRWTCAVAMFKEKPFFGWGPGTYMFQYAPFQQTDLRTIISTNSADGGNAHSEYLGPLSESGFIGMLSFLLVAFFVLKTGIRLYSRLKDRDERWLVLAAVLGLVSYLVHGFLNNFLDTDKAAIPFWGFTAFLVMLDVKYRERLKS